MRLFTGLTIIGLVFMLSVTACAQDSQSQALSNLKNMRAEDFFNNPNEIEIAKAIEWGDTKKIQELLDKGINVNIQGYRDKMNFLMWSFIKQNKKSYQYLLENKANPNQNTTNGSVMNVAVIPEDTFWLKMALEHGGNPNTDNDGRSIIFLAIENHRKENIKLLLKAGADINYQDVITKDTPLMEALGRDRYDIMYMLLEDGAKPEVNKDKIIRYINNYIIYPAGDYKEQVKWKKKVISYLERKGFIFDRTARGFILDHL